MPEQEVKGNSHNPENHASLESAFSVGSGMQTSYLAPAVFWRYP